MTIVVDVGCAPYWPHDVSIVRLIERFRPDRFYGFDPLLKLDEVEATVHDVPVTLRRRAAWIYEGLTDLTIGEHEWEVRGTTLTVLAGERAFKGRVERVRCFNLAAWLLALPEPPILKLDVEGAEYALLDAVIAQGVALERVLVEWHDLAGLTAKRRELITAGLGCPVELWE